MPPDLPAEIWLHIASLLPKGHLHKLAGINRMLFSLTMGKIYREVQFTGDGGDMLKPLQQLKYPSIASRVKHVYIRPKFFPEVVEQLEPDSLPEALLGRVKSKMSRLGRKARLSFRPRGDVLSIARRAFANCKALEELTIILNDGIPSPSFGMFLETIWSSLGPNIRRLTLDAPSTKFPLILKHGKLGLPNLTDLHINLAGTKFSIPVEYDSAALHALQCFITPLNLESLTISSCGFNEISFLLTLQRDFPRLRNLALPVATRYLDYADSFLSLFTRHKATLQHLTLTLPAPQDEPMYSNQQYVMRGFRKLELPVLQSLHIRILSEHWLSDMFSLPLSSVKLPHLVSLSLLGAYMSHEDIKTIFGDPFRGNHLQSLKLGVRVLSPKVLNALAAAVPHLTNLDIMFRYRSIANPFNRADDSCDLDFELQMRGCDYSHWMILNLRLSQADHWPSCTQPHSELRTMKIVARFLPLPVKLGVENDCGCSNG